MVILAPTKKYIWRPEGKLPEMRHSTENSSWAPEEESPMGHERLTLEQSFRLTGVSSPPHRLWTSGAFFFFFCQFDYKR